MHTVDSLCKWCV